MGDEHVSEAEALRAAVREAHEVLKDLNRAMKEARSLWRELGEETADYYAQVINKIMETLGGEIERTINSAQERVDRRFQDVADLLLGQDAATRRRGEPSLVEMAQAARTVEALRRREGA